MTQQRRIATSRSSNSGLRTRGNHHGYLQLYLLVPLSQKKKQVPRLPQRLCGREGSD